ncbi:carbon-nitrogen hydrolase family protein [Terribacillus saccharophilus]|uniref:carbon-nitrogen hydrolase family protein n=1 Tax=Terribacillus saccharophilus TaxID=361277 RepID=UPI0037F4EB6D
MKESMVIAGLQNGAYAGDVETNLQKIITECRRVIAAKKPDLLVCAELMTAPYFAAVTTPDETFFNFAEPMNGPTVSAMVELAKETDTHLIGTVFEKAEEGGSTNYYNTAFVCSPTRGLIGSYRKVHVPKVDDATMKTDEKFYFEQYGGGGDAFPTITLDNGWKIGILICFDRSFPEAWRSLRMQGVDVVVVPTATYGYRKDLYVAELRVRAMENNLFVMGVNKAGTEALQGEEVLRHHFGQSCILSPFGDVVTVTDDEEWEHVAGEISKTTLAKSRKRVDWMANRKPEVYERYQTEVLN